jgi:hypothetical protein
MALNPYLTIAAGQGMLDDLVDSLDVGGAGTIKLYADTQPTDADTAIGAQVLLATLTFPGTAFGAATAADPTVATVTPSIVDDTSADATDTLTWARWASGTPTDILDCTAGNGTFDLNFNTDQFVTGATVSISALTVTQNLT